MNPILESILRAEWCEDENGPAPEDFDTVAFKNVWWRCTRGHEWMDKVETRMSGRSSCPICLAMRGLQLRR